MTAERMKAKDLKSWREKTLKAQDNRCALCGELCSPEQAVGDHCHKNGHVRGVLHRNCNGLLGVLENNRFGVRHLNGFLSGVLPYLTKYQWTPDAIIHPSVKTPEEKKLLVAKRRKRRLKNA